MNAPASTRKPTLFESLVPIAFLVVCLSANVIFLFGDDGLSGSNQIILLMAAAVAGLMALRSGAKWDDLQQGIVDSIASATPSLLILLLIGSLAGTWMISGIVPTIIYYGLQVLHPSIFLFAACVVCAVVALATGSSWSTIATVGVAMIGIGKALGMNEGLVAGAIISGAYFGDKMSPLSDTTNLAPAMAGTDLFTHIRYMLLTTVPSIAITLVIFLVIGFFYTGNAGTEADIEATLRALEDTFNLSPLLFVVPVAVIALIVRKVPAIPAIGAGALLGALATVVFQGDLALKTANALFSKEGAELGAAKAHLMVGLQSLFGDMSFQTGNAGLDDLISTGGMNGMLGTVWLIVTAMCFGGVMYAAGMLERIAQQIVKLASSTGSLIAAAACTCIGFNLTTSDQYMAIVVPGRMYADTFRKRGLAPENLSRTLEDAGTVTSALIPWNTCGAVQASVLGVATFAYAPFAFFCLISPLMTILYGYAGIKIRPLQEPEETPAAVEG